MNRPENLWFFVGSFMVFAIIWTSGSVIQEYLKNQNQQFFKNSKNHTVQQKMEDRILGSYQIKSTARYKAYKTLICARGLAGI
jgi:6-phosphogluconate dehydrogenase (decarboxylating)